MVARLAEFSRAEIKRIRRRLDAELGPVGDRQGILSYLSPAHGAEKPVILAPDETFTPPAVLALASLTAVVCEAISRILETFHRAAA
jgi:hypothetical protein